MDRFPKRLPGFPRLLDLPENHSAWVAVHDLAAGIISDQLEGRPNPLYLHGPAGVGKSCLLNGLRAETLRGAGQTVISFLAAQEVDSLLGQNQTANGHRIVDQVDLLIIEDLHQLAPRFADQLAHIVDDLKRRRVPMVFTAPTGPRFLPFSGRLISRLVSGLVLGLESLQAPSRLKFLQWKAQQRQLAVHPDILSWLAERLRGSGRELEGALIRLEALCRLHRHSLNLAAVIKHFQEDMDANRPTLDRIVQQVSNYFRVSAAQLLSGRRDRHVLVPRQIAMYLSRRLTDLSLGEIGERFGGRDHSTVLHGCRKVSAILMNDTALAGTVLQLQAVLV
jgi:chromosomal replication initiator protein